MTRFRTILIAAIVALLYAAALSPAATSEEADVADANTAITATDKAESGVAAAKSEIATATAALGRANTRLSEVSSQLSAAKAADMRIRERNTTGSPPPTEEPPPPSDGKLLFLGDQIKDFPYVIRQAPDRITEVPDPLCNTGTCKTVFKFTVPDSDDPIGTGNPRAQMESPTFVTSGLDFWWKFDVYIPDSYPTFSGWLTLASVYGPPFAGSGPWHIASNGKVVDWEEKPWSVPLSSFKGHWNTVMFHGKFSEQGFAELWLNGVQQTFTSCNCTRLEPVALRNRTNNGGNNNIRLSFYRQRGTVPGAPTIYLDDLVAGTTRSSIGG